MATSATTRDALCALRHKIAKIEGRLAERLDDADAPASAGAERLCIGADRFDNALGGGLPRAGLVEIHGRASRDAGAAAAFALALCRLSAEAGKPAPLLWIGTSEMFREAGRPYAPGLAARFGLDPELLLVSEVRKLTDALWVAEEAARLDCFLAVLLEIRGGKLELTQTQRLHRRALVSGQALFMIRTAAEPSPTAASVRLLVSPAPAAPRRTLHGPLEGSIGPPAFHVTISKSRTAIPAAFTLEWNDVAFRERGAPASEDFVPMVSLPSGRQGAPAAPGEGMARAEAFPGSAAGLQSAREQHPVHRRARRAG
jgi:protein ImuA